MADKARRLHFTEDELSDRDIRRAAKKADKAADKADRANEKLSTKRRVRIIRDSGRAEAVEERLSDKLHQSRQSSKADREKEKAPSKRKPRATAKGGKVEATAERLSDKLRRSPQSTIAARGKLRIEVTEVTAQKPGAAGSGQRPRRRPPCGEEHGPGRRGPFGQRGRGQLRRGRPAKRGVHGAERREHREQPPLQPQAETVRQGGEAGAEV